MKPKPLKLVLLIGSLTFAVAVKVILIIIFHCKTIPSFSFGSSNFKDCQASLSKKNSKEKRPPPFPRHCEEGRSISLRLLLMLVKLLN